MISWEEIVIRIVVGAALGGLVGLEREMRGQAAGFRTHTLVAMGATLFTLASEYGFLDFIQSSEPTVRMDPTRIAAQIVVGVGFLGAGAIMRHGTSVKGLTTAASLWVVAAMGLAVGAGFYVGAITVSLLILVVLRGLRPVENLLVKLASPDEATLIIRLHRGTTSSRAVIGMLEQMDIRVREVDVESGPEATVLRLGVKLPARMSLQEAVEDISQFDGVIEATWER